VSWSGGGNPTTGTGAIFSTTWDTAGTKTATASLCESSVSKDVTIAEVASVTSYLDIDKACVGCSITFTATTDPTGYEDDVSWSGGGNPTTGTGGTFSTTWDTTGTKTVTASCGSGSSVSKQVTIAAPTNFRETNVRDLGDGRLQFTYAWDSTSGNLWDLAGCMVGEKVDYPGGNPYVWPAPWVCSSDNPSISDVEGINGGIIDTHHHGDPTQPYSAAWFTATQVYRRTDCQGNYALLMGPISIYRIISSGGPLWRYSIIKSGAYAEIFPLP
jgi:hypothetical protein